jgi:outer membrane protein assembly factor BamB
MTVARKRVRLERTTQSFMHRALSVLAIGITACGQGLREAHDETGDSLSVGTQVVTQHNDPNRTGAALDEKTLSPSTVSSASFGKLFSRSVDGQVYAQPLYVSGVLGGRRVVYVATEHNSVYAFDAADVAHAVPLWTVNLGPSVPASDTACAVITPEIGITSTPVIDITQKTMWVEANTKEAGHYIHRLHALDIETGRERPNSPTVITAAAPGTGAGSVAGQLTLDPLKHMSRPGLLKSGNTIYMAFASHCDIGPYHGWLLGYDATTLAETAVHVTTPNGSEGGIWQGGVGLAADTNGDVYYASGNGDTDGHTNFGESIVRMHKATTGLTVASWFSPFDAATLNSQDLDIGSTGVMLLPGTNLLIAGSKSGAMYVVDRTTMGGQSAGDSQIVQRFQATAHAIFGGPALYRKSSGAATLYVWGTGDGLKAFAFDPSSGTFATAPVVNASVQAVYPGGQLSISANGDNDGILWTVHTSTTGTGLLKAFAADNISQLLYASSTRAQDSLGSLAKFAAPTIADGRVYIGTADNHLVVYGLSHRAAPDAGSTDGSPPPADAAVHDAGPPPTWTELYTKYFRPGTAGHCANCHASQQGGFLAGTTKQSFYNGLVQSGLITPGSQAASSVFGSSGSPLSWFGGSMPLDAPNSNPAAAAAVTAWLADGAPNN